MSLIPTPLSPYLLWIKIIGVVVILAAVGYGGFSYGSATAHNADSKVIDGLQKGWDADKLKWSQTVARAAIDAQATLTAVVQRNEAEVAAKQSQITSLNAKYQAALKDVEHERSQVLAHAVAPVSASDGLWVDTDLSTCRSTTDPNGGSAMPKGAASGSLTGTQRCRLSPDTAEWLVDFAAQANEVVKHYNLCVGTVQTLTQTMGSQTQQSVIDPNNGSALPDPKTVTSAPPKVEGVTQ